MFVEEHIKAEKSKGRSVGEHWQLRGGQRAQKRRQRSYQIRRESGTQKPSKERAAKLCQAQQEIKQENDSRK